MVFRTAIMFLAANKPKRMGKPAVLKSAPEQTHPITRALFNIVKDHGPISISDAWSRVQEVGLSELTSKTQMKMVLKWMRERQKLKLICNHASAHKQFLYTTCCAEPTVSPPRPTKTKATFKKVLSRV